MSVLCNDAARHIETLVRELVHNAMRGAPPVLVRSVPPVSSCPARPTRSRLPGWGCPSRRWFRHYRPVPDASRWCFDTRHFELEIYQAKMPQLRMIVLYTVI